MSDPTPLPALEAERRALLGDSRSVDQLGGDALARFVVLCALIREALPASAKARPGKPGRGLKKSDDLLADL